MAFYSPRLVKSPLSVPSDSPNSQGESTCSNLQEVRGRDLERRIRREIANSNERRRMQSINSGFRTLKMLLPQAEGEKMSKAAILQQASEYIYTLQQEKARSAHQTAHLSWLLASLQESTAALQQRQLTDHHVPSPADHPAAALVVSLAETRQELAHLRIELERESRARASLEEHMADLSPSLAPEFSRSPTERDTPKGGTSETPRGTLDVIVRAIRHLEGDRAFTPVPTDETS